MATPAYEVFAVRYASLVKTKADFMHRYEIYGEADAGDAMELAYYFWVLRRDQQTVLVDTGFSPAMAAQKGRTLLTTPVQALHTLGVSPESVSTVIITHLHSDHIGNLGDFPAAEFTVPRREIEFWTSPLARRAQFAVAANFDEIAQVQRLVADGRVRMTEGTEQLLDGVTAICVGGHSPGQQVTIVTGTEGDVILASDSIHFYEELERDRPFAVLADLGDCYRAFDLLRELAGRPGAKLVAGHDPAVMVRFGASPDELVVRI